MISGSIMNSRDYNNNIGMRIKQRKLLSYSLYVQNIGLNVYHIPSSPMGKSQSSPDVNLGVLSRIQGQEE